MNQRIAELNDVFRQTFLGGEVYLTRGIAATPLSTQEAIIARVQGFDGFTPENDPYGEHDFGTFEFAGSSIYWKIDCYDRSLQYGSPDPADPDATKRFLTILFAEEY
jgi:hypothetical protein